MEMNTEPELLNERLERLAIVLDEIMPKCALLVRDAIELLKEQDAKTGAWQWKIHGKPESGGTLGEAVCDQCGKSTYATAVKGDLNYCPNCGAKMEGR